MVQLILILTILLILFIVFKVKSSRRKPIKKRMKKEQTDSVEQVNTNDDFEDILLTWLILGDVFDGTTSEEEVVEETNEEIYDDSFDGDLF